VLILAVSMRVRRTPLRNMALCAGRTCVCLAPLVPGSFRGMESAQDGSMATVRRSAGALPRTRAL
jgi:hypothetical protein